MCGVAGVYAFHPASGAPDANELVRINDHMADRGPDGSGIWWSDDRRCGLAHRRLSILDLSNRASQPMVSADGRYVISYNGEIYNYPELRKELQARGVSLRTTSDTEVLLCLYAREGAAMLPRLRGMFALAIWDKRERGVFLARDPYGIKPLYTANDGWTFRFASQVKALLAGGRVSHDPEPAGIVGFHLFGSVPEPFTLFRDIRALPAGHWQWGGEAGPCEPQSYVKLADVLARGAEHPAPISELEPRVRVAVGDSVRAHLLADVEVGAFLSAGVDSGTLLALANEAGSRLRAITLSFDEFKGTAEDEAPWAATVAKRHGSQHMVRRVTETEFREDLPRILASMDQPSIDGVNTWFVAKAAKEAGLKVALSGVGGDELLAGYPSFTDMPRWRRRFGMLAKAPGAGKLGRRVLAGLAPQLARTRPKALGVLEYSGSWAGLYLLRRGLFLPHELSRFMDPDLAREGLRRLQPLRRLQDSISPDPGSDTGRVCLLESANYMRNQLLRDTDWAGMAHGVEIRTPLVDIELLRSLSPLFPVLGPGHGKAALAAAPVQPLPADVVLRAKTGFGVPTGAWLKAASASSLAAPPAPVSKGAASRRWSEVVLDAAITPRFAA